MKLRTLNQFVALALAGGVALTAAAQGGANGTATQAATPNASAASSGEGIIRRVAQRRDERA